MIAEHCSSVCGSLKVCSFFSVSGHATVVLRFAGTFGEKQTARGRRGDTVSRESPEENDGAVRASDPNANQSLSLARVSYRRRRDVHEKNARWPYCYYPYRYGRQRELYVRGRNITRDICIQSASKVSSRIVSIKKWTYSYSYNGYSLVCKRFVVFPSFF